MSGTNEPLGTIEDSGDKPTWQRVGEVAAELADVVYVIQLEPEFRFEYVSDSVTDVVGYTPTQHYADPSLGQRLLDPRDAGILTEAMTVVEGGTADFTLRWLHADAHEVWTKHHIRKQRRPDDSVAVFGAVRDVTAEITALATARASEREYQRIIEDSAIGMCVVAADGHFLMVNDALCEYFGLPADSLMDRSWQELTHPDDVEVDLDLMHQVLAGEIDTYRLTKRYRHADGRSLVGDLSVSGMRDDEGRFQHFVSQIVDMTERARLEAQLQQSHRDYRILAEYSGDVILRVALDGRVVWASPAATTVMGWEPADLVGQRNLELIHPDDREWFASEARRLAAEGLDSSIEARFRAADGSYKWLDAVGRQVPATDDEDAFRVVRLRDISAMVAARTQLRHQATHDALTGLLRRHEMYDRVERLRHRVKRSGTRAALLYCDIDKLKTINDLHGHAAGDDYIRCVGERVAASLREGDLVARLGGDELLIAITGASDVADVLLVAEKIVSRVGRPADIGIGEPVRPSASVGITLLKPGEPLDDAVARADIAMYEAKRLGPGSIAVARKDLPQAPGSG